MDPLTKALYQYLGRIAGNHFDLTNYYHRVLLAEKLADFLESEEGKEARRNIKHGNA